MHKIVILIEPVKDWQAFEDTWPEYLRLIESVPGLQRESISVVEHFAYGPIRYARMHELFFASLEAAHQALNSPQGRAAGEILFKMTNQGHMAIFFADHKEDALENIQKHKKPVSNPEEPESGQAVESQEASAAE